MHLRTVLGRKRAALLRRRHRVRVAQPPSSTCRRHLQRVAGISTTITIAAAAATARRRCDDGVAAAAAAAVLPALRPLGGDADDEQHAARHADDGRDVRGRGLSAI